MRWFAVHRSTQKTSPSRCKEVKQSSRARCGPGPRGKKLKEQHGWLPGSPLSITRSVSYNTSRQRIPSAAKGIFRHAEDGQLHTIATIDDSARRWSLRHFKQKEDSYANRCHDKESFSRRACSRAPLVFIAATRFCVAGGKRPASPTSGRGSSRGRRTGERRR